MLFEPHHVISQSPNLVISANFLLSSRHRTRRLFEREDGERKNFRRNPDGSVRRGQFWRKKRNAQADLCSPDWLHQARCIMAMQPTLTGNCGLPTYARNQLQDSRRHSCLPAAHVPIFCLLLPGNNSRMTTATGHRRNPPAAECRRVVQT